MKSRWEERFELKTGRKVSFTTVEVSIPGEVIVADVATEYTSIHSTYVGK